MFEIKAVNDSEPVVDDNETIYIFVTNLDNYKLLDINNHKGIFVFFGNDISKLILNNNATNNYFIKKPINLDELDKVLTHVYQKVQNNLIILKTQEGNRRAYVSNLNYVDIVKRQIYYHMTNKTIYKSNTMTTSFQKAITPLDKHSKLLFLAPSLLINIVNIEVIDTNNIIFSNGEQLYVSSPQRKIIQERWEEYFQFDNLYHS